jgi:hypothetical protein
MTAAAGGRRLDWTRLALLAACAAAAWLTVRNAALLLYADSAPGRAAWFWPAGGKALAAEARARTVSAGGAVDAPARALTLTALRRAPASAPPLVLAGLAASADGITTRARALMRAAEARDPRNDVARYWLLDNAIRSGDYAAGLAEVGPALRLRAGTRPAVFALVAGMLQVPAAARAVRAELARDPDWRTDFFTAEAGTGADPAMLLRLLASLPPPHDTDAARLEQQAVLTHAVEKGDYAAAYRAWRALPPPGGGRDALEPPGTIYDPDFAGLPRSVPFNWRLSSSGGTTAALEGHALTIAVDGADPAVLAEQYTVAPPDAYVFALRARRIGAATGAHLVARVRCARDNAELATLALDRAAARIARFVAPLTIPARCGAVRIEIAAAPDSGAGPVRMQITDVRLTPGR